MLILKATREDCLAAVQAVLGTVERRHTLPILAHLLLRKIGEQIEWTSSDLEMQLRTQSQLGGDAGELATTVGARKLADILRALPAEQTVSISSAQNKLTVQAGRSRFTLQTRSDTAWHTAAKSAPAATNGATLAGVIPPIATHGTSNSADHHDNICGSGR